MKISLLATILSIQSVTYKMDMEPVNDTSFGKRDNGFSCGKVIYLWANQWTFSYHDAIGREFIHYTDTLATFPSEELARENMATYVWGLNQ